MPKPIVLFYFVLKFIGLQDNQQVFKDNHTGKIYLVKTQLNSCVFVEFA